MDVISDKQFKGIDFSKELFTKAEYENCTFNNCIFSKVNFTGINFLDCIFESCDLSMSILKNTGFQSVTFKQCKLIGLHFNLANSFSISFHFIDSNLTLSTFFQLKLKNTKFENCNLQEVDFVEISQKYFDAANHSVDYCNVDFLQQDYNPDIYGNVPDEDNGNLSDHETCGSCYLCMNSVSQF